MSRGYKALKCPIKTLIFRYGVGSKSHSPDIRRANQSATNVTQSVNLWGLTSVVIP